MKPSPLQLSYYRISNCAVKALHGFEGAEGDSSAILEHLKAKLQIQPAPENDTAYSTAWLVGLDLKLSPESDTNYPYEFHVELFGMFECAKELPPPLDAERLVGINGTSILYGVAREMLLSITDKGMWGGFLLPTMSFTDYQEMLPQSVEEKSDAVDQS